METQPRFGRLAQRALLDEPIAEVGASPDAEARAIAALGDAIAARAPRRRWARWSTMAVVAAAAAVTLGLGLRSRLRTDAQDIARSTVTAVSDTVRGETHLVTGGAERLLRAGETLDPGARLVVARDAEASLTLSTGTRVKLEGGADLTFADGRAVQRFELAAGSVHLDVAKLGPGERFLVRTGDAEIEVHGTSFGVTANAPIETGCEIATATRVVVREGIVSVRSGANELRLVAGEIWPRGCGRPVPSPEATIPPAAPSAAPTAAPPAPSSRRAPAPSAARPSALETSDLAAQNDALAKAVEAKRAGDAAAALAGFDHFLVTYPASPLTETVAVERMKLLATTHPARGLAAARDYLARYPHGFARADAEAILEGGL